MWWTSSSGKIELEFTQDDLDEVPFQGDADPAVMAVMRHPHIKEQLKALSWEIVAQELESWGSWSDVELGDHQQNLMRLVWLAIMDCKENQEL